MDEEMLDLRKLWVTAHYADVQYGPGDWAYENFDYSYFEHLLAARDRAVAANAWENCAQEAWESELLGHKKRDRLMAKNPYRITEED